MKSKLNMDSLTKPELLMLFSILEGELEARDMVIDALKAQRKEFFVQERYGRYDLSDPFLALQRDGEVVGDHRGKEHAATSNPLVVLKLVVSHCRRMQEKMLAQLAAAESRHRMVIMDLEEEKRKHAEDTAEGDDVTYILEKERERLQQQLEFERGQVRRLEKEQRRVTDQLEEERAQHKQLSCALAKECKWASARALEEGHRLAEAGRKLDKEREAFQALKEELEEERRRALRMEARVEEQLAEFDTEREQLRSRLKKEEAHCARLQQQVEELQRKLSDINVVADVQEEGVQWATKVPLKKKTTEAKLEHNEDEGHQGAGEPKVNGHHYATEADELSSGGPSNGNPPIQQSSSPCASPVLSKHPSMPTGCKSSYQAGINQRFHAARHKFQTAPNDPEPTQPTTSTSPTPSPAESSKQMARSTVTQVLSRFTTTQQAPKLSTVNHSPFGTDYRCLAAPLSPTAGRAAAPPQGVRSPTIPRADRGNPPPIPPKKPGLAQAPTSPAAVPRSGGHFNDAPHSGSCGITSAQDGVKELDVVLSSN
ncbi:CTTNBP2 N-terminal-like protein isoform X1 [Syngnathus acus]|uniref:CTTNBP2 N-terminal-like protein isoform X1 n=2 Tax=Syngnathus acus TaxID=161584 RepID=UPI001885C0AD|nr:CTTNBP2 N-terminal-like protein isoform X1 [Syngnathus acus]